MWLWLWLWLWPWLWRCAASPWLRDGLGAGLGWGELGWEVAGAVVEGWAGGRQTWRQAGL